jgi:hypothetical protein
MISNHHHELAVFASCLHPDVPAAVVAIAMYDSIRDSFRHRQPDVFDCLTAETALLCCTRDSVARYLY